MPTVGPLGSGKYPSGGLERIDLPVHIEAASLHGTPVWFNITGPWSRYREPKPGREGTVTKVGKILGLALKSVIIFTACWLAWRNLKLGRGDKRGAFRLVVLVLVMDLLYRALTEKHLIVKLLTDVSKAGLAYEVYSGLVLWTLYLAFEPSIRRLWPERIVSWNRLLAGRFRDPLVGHDVLIGCLLGVFSTLLQHLGEFYTGGFSTGLDLETLYSRLSGPAQFLLLEVWETLSGSMMLMVLLLGARVFLRRNGLAICFLWIVVTIGFLGSAPSLTPNFAAAAIGAGLLVFAYMRFGPLGGAVCYLTRHLCIHYPLTLDTSAWYWGSALFAVLAICSISLYGFSLTVAGQEWFAGSRWLQDRNSSL